MPGIATRASLLPGRTPSRGALAKTHARILGIGRRATAEPPSASPCRAPAQQAPVSIRGALGGRKKQLHYGAALDRFAGHQFGFDRVSRSVVRRVENGRVDAAGPSERPRSRVYAATNRVSRTLAPPSNCPVDAAAPNVDRPRSRVDAAAPNVRGLASTPRLRRSAVSRRGRDADRVGRTVARRVERPQGRRRGSERGSSAFSRRRRGSGCPRSRVDTVTAAPNVDRPR